MTITTRIAFLPLLAVLTVGSALTMVGCGSEEEEVAPTPVPVTRGPSYSAQDLSMDLKVQFPDKYTPMSEDLGQAIADFASAMARGDHQAFGEMLAPEDRFFHDILLATGDWEQATSNLRAVRIVNLEDGESIAKVAIAYGNESSASLTAWEARRTSGTTWQFSPLGVAPRTTSRVALLDDASFETDALWLSSQQISPGMDDEVDGDMGDDFEMPTSDGDDFSVPPSSPTTPSSPSGPASPFGG